MNTELNANGAAPEPATEQPTPMTKGGKAAAAVFWSRFPTPEARSQYMKERFAKVKAKRAKKEAREARKIAALEPGSDEDNAAESIYKLRILLGDILTLLDSCNADGHAGVAKTITGENASRKCLMAAHSLISRGLQDLNVAGVCK